MTHVRRDMRSWTRNLFMVLAAFVVCGTLQWRLPQQTVKPIADRLLCSGSVRVTPIDTTARNEVFTRVECRKGRSREDITTLTLLLLGVASLAGVMVAMVIMRRVISPPPKTRMRRAPA